ncbi:MAG: hypothetical protein F6K10_32575 [Moorea sp. SIO2B7]|nr:hypothetical protein [Moorena sp. SIO2B7]
MSAMNGRILPHNDQFDCSTDTNVTKQQSLQQAQEIIYSFFIELVHESSPETVLLEFKSLFFCCDNHISSDANQALYNIIFTNNEREFRNTLKRSCYILINNWASQRKYKDIQSFSKLLGEVEFSKDTISPTLNLLRNWVTNFIKSQEYQDIKLLASTYNPEDKGNWTNHYTSYLLVAQYLDYQNPLEQRKLARNLAKQLKKTFKFQLAMYTIKSDIHELNNKYKNPTRIGDNVIRLIKKITHRHMLFGYENYANIFIKQTQNINYLNFKKSLKIYLLFSMNDQKVLKILDEKLSQKLDCLYEKHNQDSLNVNLLLRTCRRVIDFFTTEDGKSPSSLFILMNTQASSLSLGIILLKIILICNYVRTHLEVCIAKLIRYYEKFSEDECKWFINFLEIFNIVFALYTENIQYNLVKIKNNNSENQNAIDLDTYRVFPQLKGANLRGADFGGSDLHNNNLSDADLRGANLSNADLTNADLSLAKLIRANLSGAILNRSQLVVADLNNADLSGVHLSNADIRRANLQQANLSNASLTDANLHCANLQNADLSRSKMSNTKLNASNLIGANLQYADLKNADLSDANLSNANLNHANLSGANLSNANLSNANLSYANLTRAELYQVNLSYANLSHSLLRHLNISSVNLSNANLSNANLFNTNWDDIRNENVKNTQFNNNSGISQEIKLGLEQKGAIFNKSG